MHVTVNTEKCCGAGQCVLVAPDVFDQDDDTGIVVLLDATPGAALEHAVAEAVAVCPASAIAILND